MAYNSSFTVTALTTPGGFTIVDTGSGSDPNITTRRIGLYQADGTLLGGDWIPFPLSEGNSKTLNVLNVDMSLNIVLEVISSNPLPPPSSYTSSGLYTFTGYSYSFLDMLIGSIAYTYTIVADTNFLTNMMRLVVDINNAERAEATNQQLAAQAALTRIQYLITNQQLFF